MIYKDKNGKLNLSNLHPKQIDFIKSTKLHTGVVGGYQSGKSVAGTVKTLTKLLINPNVPVAYYLPNYRLISDMLVPKFKDLFESIGFNYDHNKQESKLITDYGEIWMRSMDNPDSIISYSVGYSLVDEADLVHANKRKEAMQRIASRNSFKKSTPNCIDYVSTPEGYGYMYNFFVKKANDNKQLLRLSTIDNQDNLGEGYIQGLRESYTPDQLKAYLNGEFVNLTSGSVYNEYDITLHDTDKTISKGDVLHIGMDFNITNMSAVIHLNQDGRHFAVSEIVGAYDTSDMCRIIKERFEGHTIVVYPDASGKNRNTSGVSDIQILKSNGFVIRARSKNPFVRDRINEMNNNFQKSTYLVNRNNCPNYSDALTQLPYKNNEPDKSLGLDHICFTGETEITTINGQVKIKDVEKGDLVLTSQGYKKVLERLDNGIKEINEYSMQLDTLYVSLRSTKEHLIKTGKGWKQISQLKSGEIIYLNNSITENLLNFKEAKDISIMEKTECIDGYMKKKQEKIYQKDLMFITLIMTLKIIGLRIWNSLKNQNTISITLKKELKTILNGFSNFKKQVKNLLRGGTNQNMVLSGISNTQSNKVLDISHTDKDGVLFAKQNILLNQKTKKYVQINVKRNKGENLELTTKRENAIHAVNNLHQINIVKQKIVAVDVGQSLEKRVYDLRVEGCHEYFANSVLVHNCDAGGYYVWYQKRNTISIR